jgi:hypothetical protein
MISSCCSGASVWVQAFVNIPTNIRRDSNRINIDLRPYINKHPIESLLTTKMMLENEKSDPVSGKFRKNIFFT